MALSNRLLILTTFGALGALATVGCGDDDPTGNPSAGGSGGTSNEGGAGGTGIGSQRRQQGGGLDGVKQQSGRGDAALPPYEQGTCRLAESLG